MSDSRCPRGDPSLDMRRERQRRNAGKDLAGRNSFPKNGPCCVEGPHRLDLSFELPPSVPFVPRFSDVPAKLPIDPLYVSTRDFVPSRLARLFQALRGGE